MSDEILEVWLTRRALSVGVEKARVHTSRLGPRFVVEAGGAGRTYVLSVDAHLKKSDAVAAAEAERARRIRSLLDQIERVQRIDFDAEAP